MGYLQELKDLEPKSLHHEADLDWVSARGEYIYDLNKGRYLDFTSGIFVANSGHLNPDVVYAIKKQAGTLLHSYTFPNKPRLELVKKLTSMMDMDKAYLCTSGSEAVDNALRIMNENKLGWILSVKGCFHGRTIATINIAKSASLEYKDEAGLYEPSFISGIIFETYLGYNAQFHPKEWVQEWCSWAKDNDIPVCFDEVQAGFGRTGKMFGYEWYDVKPDLVCLGKGITSSLPLSAVVGRADLLDNCVLSSTHTGNPVCCSAAVANIKFIEENNLVERANEIGEVLRKYPYTSSRGAIHCIDLCDVDLANKVVDMCMGLGVALVKTHRGTIKIGPPLTIDLDELDRGMRTVMGVIRECR